MPRTSPFIELKWGTGVINEACNPCSFSPSLFNRINHVTMMSVSTSPNFFLCVIQSNLTNHWCDHKCMKCAMHSTTRLITDVIQTRSTQKNSKKNRLGQRVEFHHPVPFAAAPTTFRTYAASRVWSNKWLFVAYSRGIKKIEWYQRERLTLYWISILWQSQHKSIERMYQAKNGVQNKNIRNSL